jgi:hypothetical protein
MVLRNREQPICDECVFTTTERRHLFHGQFIHVADLRMNGVGLRNRE